MDNKNYYDLLNVRPNASRMPPAGKYTLLISAFWKNTKPI